MNETTGNLDAFFRLVHELLSGSFRDLTFGGHRTHSPLIVRLDKLSCRYIRIRLPQPGCIHLESIHVYADIPSGRANVAQGAHVVASSSFPGGDALLRARMLVDPENVQIGVHTDVGPKQWVRLDLDRTSCLSEIHVYNRDDMWASRIWGCVIETSLDGHVWAQIYNHGERQKQLVHLLSIACEQPGNTVHERKVALESVEILRMLLAGEQDACVVRLEKMQWEDPDTATEIRQQLSSAIFAKRQLVWNSHGVVRPFKFWDVAEKAAYLTYVKELVDDLRKLSSSVCLGFGFVLAHVRDGDLIPHDDDVDVLIAFDRSVCPTISDGLRLLEAHLVACGYSTSGDHFSHRWVMKSDWDWSYPYVDVFVGLMERGRISWYPSERNNLAVEDVFPAMPVEQFGVECMIPCKPLKYLERTYGEKWRHPDPGFGHPWDKAVYADIA